MTGTHTQYRDKNSCCCFLQFSYALMHVLCFFWCRIGEGRACWSLGNAHTALGNHDQAMHFAEKHLEICKEVNESGVNFPLPHSFVLVFFFVKAKTFFTQLLADF